MESLDIFDVRVNGVPLSRFQWCLDNRLNPLSFKMLRNDTKVKDNMCTVSSDTGELIIKLNDESRSQLKEATKSLIDIKIEKYVSHLLYSMSGFNAAYQNYTSLNKKPANSVATKKPVKKKVIVVKAKPKPIPVKKTCYARPSAEYANIVKPVSYPCDNCALRVTARQTVKSKIREEKHKQKAALQQKRMVEQDKYHQAEIHKQEKLARKQQELEWEKKNSLKWVNRCMVYWNKGRSPCFCRPYLPQAPAGTKDTCNK